MIARRAELSALLRKPSAWLPVAMSLSALAVVLVTVLVFGEHPRPDEDAAAHLFQLLIAGQVPLVAWFLARWGRIDPHSAVTIVALQLLAIAAALAPVWYLGL